MKKSTVFEGILAIALILLCCIIYFMVTENSGALAGQWNMTGFEGVEYMSVKGNDLYTFSPETLSCIGQNGEYKWYYTSPDLLQLGYRWVYVGAVPALPISEMTPTFDVENGVTYLYTVDNDMNAYMFGDVSAAIPCWAGVLYRGGDLRKRVTAISGGKELWNYTIEEPISCFDPDTIKAHDSRVYFYHNYNETVLSENGTVLFNINGTAGQVAVDGQDNVYAIMARPNKSFSLGDAYRDIKGMDDVYSHFMEPSNVLRSYDRNGGLRWETGLATDASRQYFLPSLREQYDSLPLYDNDTLYVPTASGIIAVSTGGAEKWERSFGDGYFSLLEAMPFDEQGNVYLRHLDDRELKPTIGNMTANDTLYYIFNNKQPINSNGSYVYVISPDGRSVSPARPFGYSNSSISARAGILYTTIPVNASTGGLATSLVTAYDLRNGGVLWKYTIPIEDVRKSQVRQFSDTSGVVIPMMVNYITYDPPIGSSHNYSGAWRSYMDLAGYTGSYLGMGTYVYPGENKVYVDFRTMRGDLPVWNGYVNYTYSMGIYTLDGHGRLLRYDPVDSPVTIATVNNSTIFYGTRNGGLSATSTLVAGIALAAIFFILIRFFLVGAVSRARDRLDTNKNRNMALEYIKGHPGSTLADISSDLKMNIGTVRYHMLILGINHRITSVRADDRFVRYFGNSGAYGKDEQVVISLIKRDGIRKVLSVLLDKPGLTNAQLSRELQVSESAVSKSMKTLVASDIVIREQVDGKAGAYTINRQHLETIVNTMERPGR